MSISQDWRKVFREVLFGPHSGRVLQEMELISQTRDIVVVSSDMHRAAMIHLY